MKGIKVLLLSSFLLLSSLPLLAESPSEIYYETLGGRLYDKWYAEIDIPAPLNSHPLYPKSAKYASKPKSNWRCKECHGWDYQGKDGYYKSGKHFSGIKGILGSQAMSVNQAEKMFTAVHSEIASQMKPDAVKGISQFLTTGLLDMDVLIDRNTKKVKSGNATQGKQNYEAICARCHGLDGKEPDDMDSFAEQMEGNPWEVMHKILNGQPTEQMPGFKVLGMSFVMDTMAYLQTLPK